MGSAERVPARIIDSASLMRSLFLTIAFLFCAIGSASAQATATFVPADTSCTYASCALSIVPAWDGLRVVRGSSAQRVANLHFFWPTDIEDVLHGGDASAVGADSAATHARRALQLRQAGAGFTDAGALAIGAALLRAIGAGHASTRTQVIAGVGLGALVISVPLQFAADGELSRAVWWHNLRFARPPTQTTVTLGTPTARPQASAPAASLAGTWDVEYTLDSSGTRSSSPAVRRVRGRLMFGGIGADSAVQGRVGVRGTTTPGRFAIDFTPLFGGSIGGDSAVAAGAVDTAVVREVAGTLVGADSVRIDLVPRISTAGISMSGRIQGDSASGMWIRRTACCGEVGHFRMSRIDRTPVALAPASR